MPAGCGPVHGALHVKGGQGGRRKRTGPCAHPAAAKWGGAAAQGAAQSLGVLRICGTRGQLLCHGSSGSCSADGVRAACAGTRVLRATIMPWNAWCSWRSSACRDRLPLASCGPAGSYSMLVGGGECWASFTCGQQRGWGRVLQAVLPVERAQAHLHKHAHQEGCRR